MDTLNKKTTPDDVIDIPCIANYELLERNREKAYSKDLEACPCCGKALLKPKYFIKSIYGGAAYKADDDNEYNDAWVMGVGSECRKKFPEGYVFELEN